MVRHFYRISGGVWRGDDLGVLYQGVIKAGRFHCEGIQGGASDVALLKGVDQRLLIHQSSARGINEEGVGFHFGQLFYADHASSFGGHGGVQADEITATQ